MPAVAGQSPAKFASQPAATAGDEGITRDSGLDGTVGIGTMIAALAARNEPISGLSVIDPTDPQVRYFLIFRHTCVDA